MAKQQPVARNAKQQPVARNGSPSKREKPRGAGSGASQKSREGEAASYEKDLARYLEERIKPGLNSGAIPMLAWSIAKQIARGDVPNGASKEAEVDVEDSAGADVEDSGEVDVEDSGEVDVEDSGEADVEDSGEADVEDSGEADVEDSGEADVEDSGEADVEDSGEADVEDSGEADIEDNGEADIEDSGDGRVPPDLEALQELQAELGKDWIVRLCVQGDDAWVTAEKDDGSQYLEAPTGAVLVDVVGLLDANGGRST